MTQHFIFQPGMWIGEGKINFSDSTTTLRFYTRWEIQQTSDSPKELECVQNVEMQGGEEHVRNKLTVYDLEKDHFHIKLENELVGTVLGKGIIEKKKLAWEFRGSSHFEGFEVYELQENGDYLFHAEYLSEENMRSIIEGRIWKKEKSS